MPDQTFDNPAAAPTIEQLQAQLAAAQAAQTQQGQTAADPEPTKPAPAPVEVEAEVIPASAVPAVTSPQQAMVNAQAATFLAAIPSMGDTMAALVAATESDDTGGSNHLFPILTQIGGSAGGAFQRANHMNASEAANLPEGMNAFTAVFLGYRFIASAWEDDGQSGTKKRPAFSCALPASEAVMTNQLMTIGKEYQFTKLEAKGKYDIAAGGPGHIRPQLEMLLFDPEFGELFIYQTCSHYNSAKDTRDELLKNATTLQNDTKAMLPFVGTFEPKTVRNTTKGGREIAYHYADINTLNIIDAKAKAAWDTWQKFSDVARTDAGIMDKVNAWFACSDAEVNQLCRDSLDNGAGI